MRLPGLKTARLAARWLRSRWVGGVPILGYHRVADVDDDPYDVCVSRRNFAEHVAVLRGETTPLALEDLVAALGRGEVPRRAVVVTFDDGYADNLHHAKPELERHEVPATVFIATAYLGGRYWWDELARLVPASPAELAPVLPELERRIGEGEPPALDLSGSRGAVLDRLLRRLRNLSRERRRAALDVLHGVRHATGDGDGARALTEEELLRLAEDGLVAIGAHTVSHPALAELSVERQRSEIRDAKTTLERLLGRPVTGFAYPNGSFGAATPGLVREAGFSCACASHNDLVSASSDPYRLPRLWVGDSDGDAFARWLGRWLP